MQTWNKTRKELKAKGNAMLALVARDGLSDAARIHAAVKAERYYSEAEYPRLARRAQAVRETIR